MFNYNLYHLEAAVAKKEEIINEKVEKLEGMEQSYKPFLTTNCRVTLGQ